MDAIGAVYDDWGIGADGTQPVALSADRKFFRNVTKGATVIVGRKTMLDFPGGRPLPNRRNVVLTRQDLAIEGVEIVHSTAEADALSKADEKVFVIGGGTVYKEMLPLCEKVYVTKIHAVPDSDTFFPNLDEDPSWKLAEVLQSGEEYGVRYEMCVYERV